MLTIPSIAGELSASLALSGPLASHGRLLFMIFGLQVSLTASVAPFEGSS